MDKKDEQELKEWKEKNLNYIENYGIDIFKDGKKKRKIEKIIDIVNRIIKCILIIFALLIVLFTAFLLIYRWAIINNKLHINPKETVENMYKIKLNEVYSSIDSNQNGVYIFELKDIKEIRFNVKVEWAEMNEDYADNCQKYFYDKWENANKSIINTNSSYYEDTILKYEQFIQISDYIDLENAVRLMYDLVEFAKDKFSPDWELYLKVGENSRIYPFAYYDITLEKSIEIASREYENLVKNP